MEQEIVKAEPQEIQVQAQSPVMQLAGQLAAGNISAEQMEKMLDVQIKWEDNEAKKAYHAAMAKFQENAPSIIKSKKGHNCKYADLAVDIVAVVAPMLSAQGLSHSWVTKMVDAGIEVACKITHAQGYSELTSMVAAPDTSGKKNDVQAIGSTVTYLQRYTLKSALGLAEADQGNNGAGNQTVKTTQPTEDEKKAINKVFDALLDSVEDDKMIDIDKFTAELYVRAGNKYPQLQGLKANDWAKWVIDGGWLNLVCKPKTNN